MRFVHRSNVPGLFLILALACCSTTFGAVIKAADTSTPIPGGNGTFTGFGTKISLDQGDVAFIGNGTGQQGVYMFINGELGVVADRTTVIPAGSGGNFTAFSNLSTRAGSVSIKRGKVAFLGEGTGLIDLGIYTNMNGTLEKVASAVDQVPGGSDFFIGFSNPAISEENVAFQGAGFGGNEVIATGTGNGLTTLVDRRTIVPGGEFGFIFLRFNAFARDHNDVVFGGRGGPAGEGVYKLVSGTLHLVANEATPIPDGVGTFDEFGFNRIIERMSLSQGRVAFIGFGVGQVGVYTDVGDSLAKVADLNDPIPGGDGATFTGFQDVSINGDTIAFLGVGPGRRKGIYEWFDDTLFKIIDLRDGELLEPGKMLIDLDFHSEGLSEDQVAFWARFDDGSQGIYIADTIVPEPTTVVLCGLVALAAGPRRR